MTRRSISAAITRLAVEEPDRVAVVADDGALTTLELDLASNRLARAYAALGVGHDDHVTVSLPNSLEYVVVCAAIWKLGATPQPVAVHLPVEQKREIVALASSALVVGAEAGSFGAVPCVPAGFRPADDVDVSALPDAWSSCWKAPTSSGSTGRPKIIRAAAPALIDPTTPVTAFIPLRARQLVSGPLSHSATFTYAFRGLMTGHTLVILPRFDERRVLATIESQRIDWLLLVPTTMHRLVRLPAEVRAAADVSSVRTLLHLGAPCAPNLKREILSWFGPSNVVELYVGTESSGLTMIRGDEWLAHPGSVGRPAGGSQMEVRRPDGEPCAPGEVGEVWMRRSGGPTYEYLGSPDRRKDGWDSLRDLGRLDDDGYLYIVDRLDDVVITGGVNVYPIEVEQVLEQHPLVRGAVAFGVPDDELGQRIEAVVDVADAPSTAIDEHELLQFARSRLDPEKRPRTVRLVHEPVRSDAGKASRGRFGTDAAPPG